MGNFSVKGTKYGYNSLASGDVILKLHIDVSQAELALPFFALDPNAHLKVTFEDADSPAPDPDKQEKNKLMGKIHMFAQEIGYSEEARRRAYKNLTGKTTLTDMDLPELKTVESDFYHTLNPVGEPK